jgi:hypothetical protein
MNDLILKIIKLSIDSNNLIKIESLIEEKLADELFNIELWLRLAVLELASPLVDCDKSIICLKEVLALEKDNPYALLILAYINNYDLGGIDQPLFDRLNNVYTTNDQLNSMLKYAASWFHTRNKDTSPRKSLLLESIKICREHVYNYLDLAKIYFVESRDEEAKVLIERALNNITKVYSNEDKKNGYDLTDVDLFLSEQISGIYQTNIGLESIKEFKEKKGFIYKYNP